MHRPARVTQDGIDEVVGIVHSVSLVGLRDRPEQQPADRLPRESARLGDHGVMDITAISRGRVMETAPTTTIALAVVRRMLWPAVSREGYPPPRTVCPTTSPSPSIVSPRPVADSHVTRRLDTHR